MKKMQKIRMILEIKDYDLGKLGKELIDGLVLQCKRDQDILKTIHNINFDEYPKLLECLAKKANSFSHDIGACGKYSRLFKMVEKIRPIFFQDSNCDIVIFLKDNDEYYLISGFENIVRRMIDPSLVPDQTVFFIDCDYLYDYLVERLL